MTLCLWLALGSLTACSSKDSETPPRTAQSRLELELFRDQQGMGADTVRYSFTEGDSLNILMDGMGEFTNSVVNCERYGQWTEYLGEEKKRIVRFSLHSNCELAVVEMGDSAPSYKFKPEALAMLKGLLPEKANVRFDFMEGRWKQKEQQGESFEVWTREGKDWEGAAWTLNPAGDTVFKEKLRVAQEGGEYFYIADVEQNAQPVAFKLTRWEPTRALFENPEHDFPQTILYRRSGDTLHARIEGFVEGQRIGRDFWLFKAE